MKTAQIIWGAAVGGLLLAGVCAVSAGMKSSGPATTEAAAEPQALRLIADACPAGLRRIAAHGEPEVFVDVPSAPAFDARALMRFVARVRAEGRSDAADPARLKSVARETLGSGMTSFDDVVPSLCSLLQDDDPAVRADALTALGVFRRLDGEIAVAGPKSDGSEADGSETESAEVETESPVEAGAGGDEVVAVEEEPEGDFRSRVTVVMMTTGLADAEPVVRDAAYETLVGLPDEERAQLSLQLLGNDDAALKQALLAETAQTDDEQSLTLNFHGLDAEEPEIRQLAADNIREKTGQTFESSEQAFAWYEKQLSEEAGSAEEAVAGDPESAEGQSVGENLSPSTETEQEQQENEN